jgi:hypothetical protein
VPERDAAACNLGDGYLLIATGLKREKSGELTADLMLQNGKVLYADRGVLNTAVGRRSWATAAHAGAQEADGPSSDRMEQALQEHVLPDALAILQEDPKKPTQADLLVGMVVSELVDFASDIADAVELFHDAGGGAFATIPISDHRETWPLHSKGFRMWMARRYHEKHGKTPNTQALADATAVLAGRAIFDGPEYRVHLRLAEHERVIYLDLCNDRWEAIAVSADGWEIVANPPIKFRRTRGMLPLPIPIAGGDLRALRRFVNLPSGDAGDDGDDAPWILVIAWLLAAFRPRGPYPVLVVLGEQGSAKSTLLRVLRALVDPNKAPIRSLPRDERDLMIAATNGWCLAFDNLSHLQDYLSDALCRVSTGGGFSVRELYSDQDETILDVQRPVALNGIEEVVTRNDLLDRSAIVSLPSIPRERRQPEKRFWADFDRERPQLLGAVLDALSTALSNEAAVVLDGHPRMADFAEWIVAAEPALPWRAGAFLRAYSANQNEANDLTLEASPPAQALLTLMSTRTDPWAGTATELLHDLEEITDEKTRKQKSWPGSAGTLSNVLRRLAVNLRAVGVEVTFGKAGRRRIIRIEQADISASRPSPSSPGAADHGDSGDDDTAGDDGERLGDDGSSLEWEQDPLNWWENPESGDDGDDGDDDVPTHSAWDDFREPEDEAGDDPYTRAGTP